jgi:hypothetical protein
MGQGAKENNARWRSAHTRRPGSRVYLHVTTSEGFPGAADRMFVDHLTDLHRTLQQMGYTEDELALDLEPTGRHDESCWSARFPRMLRWLFENREPSTLDSCSRRLGCKDISVVLEKR